MHISLTYQTDSESIPNASQNSLGMRTGQALSRRS